MIELHDVTVRFGGRTVLDRIELTIPAGTHAAIMGPSGVGKTTLLRLIAGILAPDEGEVRVHSAHCAMLFQTPRLLPWLTAAENVNCVLSDRARTMPEAVGWLKKLGLEAGLYPAELSGGMQQRVALARALAFGGEPVLLDEPFQGLDEDTKREAIDLCRETLRGTTTLLVTHEHREALALADKIYILGPEGLRLEQNDK